MITKIAILSIGAYLLGSISSAVIICKLWRLPDPRAVGSNNPGATNVLRVGGKWPAILTLVGDASKGALAVLIAKQLNTNAIELASVMVAVFIGHLYPIFFRFQGGKGVATACGVLTAFSWQLGLLLISFWTIIFTISKISSLAAIGTAFVAMCCSWWLFSIVYSSAITVIVLLLLWRHKTNIKRLLTGQEAKFGVNKKCS